MILLVLFVVFFVGGPLVFRALTQAGADVESQQRLILGTLACAALGLAMRYGFAGQWGRDVLITSASMALIWFAWIGVLAFGAQALRRVDGGLRMRRLTGVIGAAGTTVPWFGLASASYVQG